MCLNRSGILLGWNGAVAPRIPRRVFATMAAVVLMAGWVGAARAHVPVDADRIARRAHPTLQLATAQVAMVLPKVTPEFADRETIIWLAEAGGIPPPDDPGLAFGSVRWYHRRVPSATSLCPLPCLRTGSAPKTSTRG